MKLFTHRLPAALFALAAVSVGLFYFGEVSTAQHSEKDNVEATASEAGQIRAGKGDVPRAVAVSRSAAKKPENLVNTDEVEPNGTIADAMLISSDRARIRGNIFPNADVDIYAFYANAGDRVFASTMTSASTNVNSTLELIAPDGATVIETDLDDGTFGTTAASIAGRAVPSSGLHYLRVTSSSTTTNIRYYDLYLRVQSGAPGVEVEPNNGSGTATPMNANLFMAGAINSPTDTADYYSFTANAGDTVFLSLDMDPERDGTTWNARLGIGLFNNFILLVNDASTTSPNSEAHFFTVKESGTYYAFVDPSTAGAGTETSTYNLSVTVFPQKEYRCTTYTTAAEPQPIGPDTGSPAAVQTITVPDSKNIAKIQIGINLTHTRMQDIDLFVSSPNGNDMVLFNDVGASTINTAGQTEMDLVIDDDAAIPIGSFTIMKPMHYQPENFTRLWWVRNTNAQGTWTLTARDDLAAEGGTLQSWSLTVCEEPGLASIPSLETTIFATDFETDASGFTTAGTANEWERGLPSTTVAGAAVIDSCNSGTNCFKTDLDNTYDASSNQDLISPEIDLTGQAGRALTLSWAHRYQVESATFDRYWVEVTEVGGSGMTRRVYEHLSNTMNSTVGSPTVTIEGAAGWATERVDISDFAGKTIQVKFHLETDSSVNEAGVAVDDVRVVALKDPPPADFDGDGGTDVSVFRANGEDATDGRWYILTDGGVISQQFGLDTDAPVPADWDGDGDVDIAVFRASEGRWYISRGSRFDFDVINWGTAGDVPVPADYDGDGTTDAAVFRPSNNTWYIRRSSDGGAQYAYFGLPTDILVPRDYDGDGKADVAVFRDGVWYIQQSFYGTVRIEYFGTAGDIPVTGDYDGDRRADLAVYRNGVWYVKWSSTGAIVINNWGLPTDIPVPGDYDRDRKTDLAVYRDGVWYILQSSDNTFVAQQFGIAGDIPLPARD